MLNDFRMLFVLLLGAWLGEDSAQPNPGLWEGAWQLSTRRAGGVGPEGGRFCGRCLWEGCGMGGRGPAFHRLSMGNPIPPAGRHPDGQILLQQAPPKGRGYVGCPAPGGGGGRRRRP